MPRLTRWLLGSLTVLSLLLCAATCVLWVRSDHYWEWAAYQRPSDGRTYTATSRLRAVQLDVTQGLPVGWIPRRLYARSDPLLVRSVPPPGQWQRAGIGFGRATLHIVVPATGRPGTATSASLTIAYPWLTLLTALGPAAVGLAAARRYVRRSPPGHCPRCRYNLTGNVSGVCPECGTKVALA